MTRHRSRLDRERKTVAAMIQIYCRNQHRKDSIPCPECRTLLEYATSRIEACPFRDDKPTCASCAVHCYRTEMREQIRAVMRYAGPRMLARHPLLAVTHLIDGRRRQPKT
ncbi:nitrous oxide-stimulated promoter family protein [Candidatus Bipolaricaulota bacterium]